MSGTNNTPLVALIDTILNLGLILACLYYITTVFEKLLKGLFMFKKKQLGIVFIAATFMFSGCSFMRTGVVNLHSDSGTTGAGVLYVPENNGAYITHVNGSEVTQYSLGIGAPVTTRVKTVYVSPGQTEFEVHAYWNGVDHYTAGRINVRAGHAYRIVFDKPSSSFQYEDIGRNMSPSGMRTGK